MSRVLTRDVALAFCRETSVGVAATSGWRQWEPNTINQLGPTIATVARNPISKRRQRRKGSITDLDSAVELEMDLTRDAFMDLIEGFMFSSFQSGPASFVPTAVVAGGSGGYTVASGGALAANTLIYVRGCSVASNNGLKLVALGSTGTNIRVDSLTGEASLPSNATVEVCGVRGASGDLTVDSSGRITSTVLDFTTLGLTAGQYIWVGGESTTNQFALQASASQNYATARLTIVAANLLTLDKRLKTFATDAGTSKLVDIYFGKHVKNVDVDNGFYLERSFHIEAAYPNLMAGPLTGYEYAIGNYSNQLQLNMPITDKATMTVGFIGTNTEAITSTRKTGASSALVPVQTASYNTTQDFNRLRITQLDEAGLTTDFKDLTITLNNNVSPEKVLGVLGARYMNTGNFELDIDGQFLFSDEDVVVAIRDYTTVTMEWCVRNDDGGILFEVPAMTMGDGAREFPANESVLIGATCQAFQDPTYGSSLMVSMFPFMPNVDV